MPQALFGFLILLEENGFYICDILALLYISSLKEIS